MVQIAIALTGLAAIYLTQQTKHPTLTKYACILGLIGQPFWFYETFQAQQWGIFVLCFGYTYAWCLGFYNNWIK